ncbi:MAG: cytochrome c oxidase subunit 4 [Anaerolineales bacterium]|jgi:cytochrome c oxidase subunit 1
MPNTEKPDVHLPQPSWWPIVLALGVLLIALGVVFTWIASLLGVAVLLGAIIGWTLENRIKPVHEEAANE